MSYSAGDIILSKYRNFDGVETSGLFLILYSEEYDSSTLNKRNFTVLKVTSQLVDTTYTVKLKQDTTSFLDKDCYVACAKIQTLSKSQVIKVLGKLSVHDMMKVYKVYKRYLNEQDRQYLERIEVY